MKSAIEENWLAATICYWWLIAKESESKSSNVINWLFGSSETHHDEMVSMELNFLSHILYEKRMLP